MRYSLKVYVCMYMCMRACAYECMFVCVYAYMPLEYLDTEYVFFYTLASMLLIYWIQ